jgi:hypothetical protein
VFRRRFHVLFYLRCYLSTLHYKNHSAFFLFFFFFILQLIIPYFFIFLWLSLLSMLQLHRKQARVNIIVMCVNLLVKTYNYITYFHLILIKTFDRKKINTIELETFFFRYIYLFIPYGLCYGRI